MAGIFDFLNEMGGTPATQGQPVSALPDITPMQQQPLPDLVTPMQQPQLDPGGLKGVLSGLTKTGDDGVTFADKLYAAGGIMRDDPGAMGAINSRRAEFKAEQKTQAAEQKALAERQRKARALQSAYIDGKFNPRAYIDALAGDVTADELAGFTKLAPKSGVDGGFAYTQDTFSGETQFGAQRPMSYTEQIAEDRLNEQERRNQVLEGIALSNLGLSRQREGRLAAGGGGGGGAPNSQGGGSSAPRISTPAQLQALPSGSLYVAPDGTTRRKR